MNNKYVGLAVIAWAIGGILALSLAGLGVSYVPAHPLISWFGIGLVVLVTLVLGNQENGRPS